MIKAKIQVDIKKIPIPELIDAIDLSLDDIADVIFMRSQDLIHEQVTDTGALAKSGDIVSEKLKKEVGYHAVHAPIIEFGRDGSDKYPPIDAIRTWCRRKLGLSGKELESATWAIATQIKNEGFEAKPFLRPALEEGKRRAKELIRKRIERMMK